MMKFAKLATAAMGFALSVSAPAFAQNANVNAANRADAQCLGVFTMLFAGDGMADMDAEAKAGGMVLVGYYLGRIEGRTPNIDMSALLQTVITEDLGADGAIDSIALRCASEAEAVANRMIATGEALQNLQ